MKLNIEGQLEDLRLGIDIFQNELDFNISDDGIKVKVEKVEDAVEVFFSEGQGIIRYTNRNNFFRALGIFIDSLRNKKSFAIIEKPQFDAIGITLDVSRNAVMKPEIVKMLLKKMALMGINTFKLYTEDIYEVHGEPYFGYMRGRYTYQELKEMDDYADVFGIEMIACIQTLGHMEQFLKWENTKDLRDTSDVLLVDYDKTYEFIEKMIVSATSPLRSKRVHIGMDEADTLGSGTYMRRNGYQDRIQILNRHLKRVLEITRKHNLKPMMWSDMFFQLRSTENKYYDLNVSTAEQSMKDMAKDVQLVYWDYYHSDEEFYHKFIKKHQEMCDMPIFAGGIWTWCGMGVNYGRTFSTTNAALKACKEEGVKEIFATIWGDDGSENNFFYTLLGLQLFAEHGYSREFDNTKLENRIKFCTGIEMQAFVDLKYLDEIPGCTPENPDSFNPSKYLLWQDILMGLFDKHIDGLDLSQHYEKLELKMRGYKEQYKENRIIFEVPEKLCSVLIIKGDIGIRIKLAWDKKDLATLKHIAENDLHCLYNNIEELRKAHRNQWMETYKPFGWEVLDIRYGGLLARVESAKQRLSDYLEKNIDTIEELEQERLEFPINYESENSRLAYCNKYQRIVTTGVF